MKKYRKNLSRDFPIKFIKEENYDYEGDLPANEFYTLDNKSSSERKRMEKVLAEEREEYKASNKKFNFCEELIKYCYNDVYILATSMTTFLKAFEELTDVCLLEVGSFPVYFSTLSPKHMVAPFPHFPLTTCVFSNCLRFLQESVTIALAAMTTFRRNHLQRKFPIVLDVKPSASYNASIKSQKYLAWIGHRDGVQVEISSTYGEKKIGKYRVDGFIEKCEKYPEGKIIEFNVSLNFFFNIIYFLFRGVIGMPTRVRLPMTQ